MAHTVNYRDVNSFLNKCSEELIRYIELQLAFAKDLRAYQLEFGVSNERLAQEFQCDVKHVEKLRKGAVEISLRDTARLHTLYANRVAEEKMSLKTPKK